MVHIGTTEVIDRVSTATTFEDRTVPFQHSVLIVGDHEMSGEFLDSVCEFLDIRVEHATPVDDLGSLLSMLRPMAVIAGLDGDVQDGFHVMKVAAEYNRALPILLIDRNDPKLLGAVDAVREVWGLTRVATSGAMAGIGALVDFMCHAARDAGRSRLMRV